MRFVIVIAIWILCVGGLHWFLQQDTSAEQTFEHITREVVTDRFHIEVTCTFGLGADPFAIRTEQEASQQLLVRVAGEDTLVVREDVSAGTTLETPQLTDLPVGDLLCYVEASPQPDELDAPNAMRVRLFRGEQVIDEEIIWVEPGQRAAAEIVFRIDPLDTVDHEDRGH